MTAKFGYVTTACRLCEDIVPPDGGGLRCGAIDGSPVGSPLQPVLPYVRQRVSKRYRHGSLRWKRPAESHHEYQRHQLRAANPLSYAGHVPLLQPVPSSGQTIDLLPSGETTQLPVQRGVCGRLQQIPSGEERRPLHRVQPEGPAAAAREEPAHGAPAQVFLFHDRGPRLRRRQAQPRARWQHAQVPASASAA